MSNNKSLPLKLKDSDGNLQQINVSEKNYVAYLAGLQTAQADSSDVGLLTLSSGGNRLIGSLTDTYYPESVGTHPYDQTSVVTTTTNLYQINGTALENDSDWRKPVASFATGSHANIYEMADSDLNIFVDDVNSRIALSDYPGSLKLSSTRPSADYDILIPSILTDQRADSSGSPFTVNDYSIWRRTSMTAPTSIRDDLNGVSSIVGIKRSSGDSGDYEGLVKLTDRQVQVTIGQRAKTRRAIDNNVGSYKLRTSSQGAPAVGTWKNVGSATNTIRVVDEQNYTRTRVSAYTRDRNSAYTRVSSRTINSSFAGNYIGNYTRDFAGNYTRGFLGNYVGDFTGNYTRDFAGNYTRDVQTNFAGDYIGNYSRGFIGNYSRDFAGNYTRNFAGNFVGEYTRTSTRGRISAFTRTRSSTYSRNFVGNYTRGFIGDYAGNFVGEYLRTSTRTRTSSYTTTAIEYTFGFFVGNYTRLRTSSYTRNSTRTRISSYTRTFTQTIDYIGNYSRNDFTRSSFRDDGYGVEEYVGNYIGTAQTFLGNYVGVGASTRVSTADTEVGVYDSERWVKTNYTFSNSFLNYTTFQVYWGDVEVYNSGNQPYLSDTTTAVTGGYVYNRVGDPVDTGGGSGFSYAIYNVNRNVIGSYTGNFIFQPRSEQYSRDFVGDFTGNYIRNITDDYTRSRRSTFIGNFIGDFTRGFAGNYVGDYARVSTRTSARTRFSAYARTRVSNYSRGFIGNYSRTFAGDYVGNYTRTSTRTRASSYSRLRTSTYTRTRTSTYAGNYVGDYVGNFIGEYTRTRNSAFTRNDTQDFTRNRVSTYTRDRNSAFTRDSTRSRSSSYVGEYTGNYSRSFVGNYSRSFVGDYIGQTISNTTYAVETYTLYVRTA